MADTTKPTPLIVIQVSESATKMVNLTLIECFEMIDEDRTKISLSSGLVIIANMHHDDLRKEIETFYLAS